MYEIKRTSIKGDYSLLENDEEIFVFKHNNWLTGVADAYYFDEHIQIKKKHALSSAHLILKDGVEVGKITFDWKMTATIQVFDVHGEQRLFLLRKKGNLKPRFELICRESHQHILTLRFNMNWRKFTYNYNLKVPATDSDVPDIPELIIYSMYASKRYRAMMASA